jgi:hypothetical protein
MATPYHTSMDAMHCFRIGNRFASYFFASRTNKLGGLKSLHFGTKSNRCHIFEVTSKFAAVPYKQPSLAWPIGQQADRAVGRRVEDELA